MYLCAMFLDKGSSACHIIYIFFLCGIDDPAGTT